MRFGAYVCGRRGRYEINPPIIHPPRCVCAICPRHRPTAESWNEPLTIRARRRSTHPYDRLKSAIYAAQIKRDEEERLREAVVGADERRRAAGMAVDFGTVCDAYREHMRSSGKRVDRAESRIGAIENFFGRGRDASLIGWAEYQELLAEVALLAPQTRRHYAATLLAMLNFASKHRVIPGAHALGRVPLPTVHKSDRPVTWTKKELAVLLGPAMDAFEREQGLSSIPLRGLCLVAYFTLMRPKNNLALSWQEIDRERGCFALDEHKNANRGIRAEGPLAPRLSSYLDAIRPVNASGVIHINVETGRRYVDIRKPWKRLVAIAGDILCGELTGRKADFFTFRHTGASHLAEKTSNPILIVKMMGDTNVQTVMRHYFNLDLGFMAEMVSGWELPTVDDGKEAGEELAN